MGQEITSTQFKKSDFDAFAQRLKQETELLADWFAGKRFENKQFVAGFELEAWLIDHNYLPSPCNEAYLARVNNPLVTPELAKFNVELNGNPQSLQQHGLRKLHDELENTWALCNNTAKQLNAQLTMIGILPTVSKKDLTLDNMSDMKRYRALNEQVLRLRKGKPLNLNIKGHQHLKTEHKDVMLESAATSLQIHLQVPVDQAMRYHNAAQILSGPMVAITANSPFLFGHHLWDETRIPLFEQAVEVGGFNGAAQGPMKRVCFGSTYVRQSLMECFTENIEHYPVLLPILFDEDPAELCHLRLHNGTIWRWNRPLIGFVDNKPHLRIEHRVMAAGPTVIDTLANMAFFFGAVHQLAQRRSAPEQCLPFSHVKDNFYSAAKSGLDTQFVWLDGNKISALQLLGEELLPMARTGLEMLNISSEDIDLYTGIIEKRIQQACNGANWQKAFVAKYGTDMTALTKAYVERQSSGTPVHNWDL